MLVLVAAAYLRGLGNGFVWLDEREIVERALIVERVGEIPGLFLNDRNYAGYHRPVYDLLHSLDAAVWGLHPFGFHASSLGLHLTNVALVWLLARRNGYGDGAATALAGLWGLHPVNAATVGLIHAKADLFVATLLLVSFLLLQRARETGRASVWVSSFGCFVLAVFTKETAFVYPLVVTILWASGMRPRRRAHDRILGAYAAAAWLGALAVAALRLEFVKPAAAYGSPLAFFERVATFGVVYLEYLFELAVPFHLSVGDTVTRFAALSILASAASLLAMTAVVAVEILLAMRWRRLRPWIGLYNLSLLPVSQVVPILHFRADRFLYLPSLFFIGAGVEGMVTWARAQAVSPGAAHGGRRTGRALTVAVAVVSLLEASLVARRSGEFRDDRTLFEAETGRVADYREGLAMLGRAAQHTGDLGRAKVLYRRALVPRAGRLSYVDADGDGESRVRPAGRESRGQGVPLRRIPPSARAERVGP